MSRLTTKQRHARRRGKDATRKDWHVTDTAWDFGPGCDIRHYWRRLENPYPKGHRYADLRHWEYGRTPGGPTSLCVGDHPLSASVVRDGYGRVPTYLGD